MGLQLYQVSNHEYDGSTKYRFYRELDETRFSPNGNALLGYWCLCDMDGNLLDFDKYRFDLAERNGLKFGQS